MAVTRSFLKGMGLTDEQVSAIVEAHGATVDGLKAEITKYKEDAEKLPAVQKELDALKEANSKDDWQGKYTKEHEAFEKYKGDVENEKTLAAVKTAYRKLLTDSKVGEKHLDAILRVTDFSKMKLDKDGKLTDADKLTEGIKTEWSGFIGTERTQGADVPTPPAPANPNGANPLAAQIAAKFQERRYGTAPAPQTK